MDSQPGCVVVPPKAKRKNKAKLDWSLWSTWRDVWDQIEEKEIEKANLFKKATPEERKALESRFRLATESAIAKSSCWRDGALVSREAKFGSVPAGATSVVGWDGLPTPDRSRRCLYPDCGRDMCAILDPNATVCDVCREIAENGPVSGKRSARRKARIADKSPSKYNPEIRIKFTRIGALPPVNKDREPKYTKPDPDRVCDEPAHTCAGKILRYLIRSVPAVVRKAQLIDDMGREGFMPETVRTTLSRLVKRGLVDEQIRTRFRATVALSGLAAQQYGLMMKPQSSPGNHPPDDFGGAYNRCYWVIDVRPQQFRFDDSKQKAIDEAFDEADLARSNPYPRSHDRESTPRERGETSPREERAILVARSQIEPPTKIPTPLSLLISAEEQGGHPTFVRPIYIIGTTHPGWEPALEPEVPLLDFASTPGYCRACDETRRRRPLHPLENCMGCFRSKWIQREKAEAPILDSPWWESHGQPILPQASRQRITEVRERVAAINKNLTSLPSLTVSYHYRVEPLGLPWNKTKGRARLKTWLALDDVACAVQEHVAVVLQWLKSGALRYWLVDSSSTNSNKAKLSKPDKWPPCPSGDQRVIVSRDDLRAFLKAIGSPLANDAPSGSEFEDLLDSIGLGRPHPRLPESYSRHDPRSDLITEKQKWWDLRSIPSAKGASVIPASGNSLTIVAAVSGVLHIRIFDRHGEMIVNTNEGELAEQARPIEHLKRQLRSLRPPYEFTGSEKIRVIVTIASIVGRTAETRGRHRVGLLSELGAFEMEQPRKRRREIPLVYRSRSSAKRPVYRPDPQLKGGRR